MKRFITLVIAVAIVGAVILVDAADARACSPISETVLSTIPADGAHAPPNTRIIALTGGLTQGDKELTLTADDGQEISGQVVWDNMAGLFTGFRKFIPDDQLDPGEYSLHIDYEPIGMDDFEMSFIVPTVWEPWPQPEAVDFQWYQETFEKDRGDSCYYNDELNELAIEPLDIEPDYYEIIFHRSDGNERIRIHEPEDVDGELRAYELGDVDCVTVSAARIDGVHSPAIERCQPDKCKHYDDEGYELGITDWEDVPGCNGDGDSDGNGDGNGDGDQNASGDTNSEVEEESESSCTTATGSTPSTLLLLLIAGLVVFRRQASRPG